MHAAPSVSYPVGRSAFGGGLCVLLGVSALATAGAWTLQADIPGWRHGLAFACVLAWALPVLAGWLRSPVGALRWNGTGWEWQQGLSVGSGQLEPVLDLQSRLLLRWRPQAGRARWLWAERKSAPADWDALRRAVYSRASAPIPTFPLRGKEDLPDGKPPAAEQ